MTNLPDGYLPREGDVLILHGRVKYDVDASDAALEGGDLKVWVRLIADFQDRRVPLSTVVGLYCRKWNLGDRVQEIGNPSVQFDVIAILEDFVWMKKAAGVGLTPYFATLHANQIEPAPVALTEETCPGHVASENDPKICGRCGTHIDGLRPPDEAEPEVL